MRALIKYAFEVNIGGPYLLLFPFVFFAPGPLWVAILGYLAAGALLLFIAWSRRRYEQKSGLVRPSAVESRVRGLMQVPKVIGTDDRPSVLGIATEGQYVNCHLLSARVGDEIHALIVSRRWPNRIAEFLCFGSVGEWRSWARLNGVIFLAEGKYADAVYERFFEQHVDRLGR